VPTVRIQRAKQDEQYWKARMRVLQTALDNDRTFLTAAKKRLTDLDRQVHRSVDDVLYVRDGLRRATLDGDYQAAVIESLHGGRHQPHAGDRRRRRRSASRERAAGLAALALAISQVKHPAYSRW